MIKRNQSPRTDIRLLRGEVVCLLIRQPELDHRVGLFFPLRHRDKSHNLLVFIINAVALGDSMIIQNASSIDRQQAPPTATEFNKEVSNMALSPGGLRGALATGTVLIVLWAGFPTGTTLPAGRWALLWH